MKLKKNENRSQQNGNHVLHAENDMSNDTDVHKISLQDRRCYDNTLQVQIAGLRSTALVDTGATISVLSTSLFAKINPMFVKDKRYLPTARLEYN